MKAEPSCSSYLGSVLQSVASAKSAKLQGKATHPGISWQHNLDLTDDFKHNEGGIEKLAGSEKSWWRGKTESRHILQYQKTNENEGKVFGFGIFKV